MALDEEVNKSFEAAVGKYVGNKMAAPYQDVVDGLSLLKGEHRRLSEEGKANNVVRHKQLEALYGILLENLKMWNGHAFFLFDDVFAEAKVRSKEIYEEKELTPQSITQASTKGKIREIVSELSIVQGQNGIQFLFKGTVDYCNVKHKEYGVIYYMRAHPI